LDQVLNHNRRLAVDSFLRVLFLVPAESLLPTIVTKRLEILVHNVGGHDSVHNEIAEALELGFSLVDAATQIDKAIVHEQIPSEID
jgi:hypothetical protein